MGFFDRFRKKDQATAPPPAETPAPAPAQADPPPDVVVVARRGISIPPDDYIEVVLRADCVAAAGEATRKVPLSQPNWPRTAELMDSNVAAIVRALAREHEIDPGKSSYIETQGPDGAEVLLVLMWR